MKSLIILFSILFLNTFIKAVEIDNKYLKCLVCRSTVKEIEEELAKIDPSQKIDVGNYRLDAKGNIVQKKVPLAQSEVHISDVLDSICDKMSDYVRATYKSNGQLTILNLISASGSMNPEMSKVDIIQDGDMNKSLQFYCEGLVEEYEDNIISLFSRKKSNIKHQLCTNITKACSPADFAHEDDEDVEKNDINEEHHEL